MEKILRNIFALASLLLLTIAISSITRNLHIKKNGIHTVAKVIKIQNQEVGPYTELDIDADFRKITLEYQTFNGETFYFSPSTTSYKKAEINDIYPISYMEEKPSKAIVLDFKSIWTNFIYFLLLGLFFTAGTIFIHQFTKD